MTTQTLLSLCSPDTLVSLIEDLRMEPQNPVTIAIEKNATRELTGLVGEPEATRLLAMIDK